MSAKKRSANQMNRPNAEMRRPKDDPRTAAMAEPESKKGNIIKTVLTVVVLLLVIWAFWKKFFPPPIPGIPPKERPVEKKWESAVDGERMMGQIHRLLAIGPRVAGTPGSLRAQAMIKAELAAVGITDIREQKFTEKTPEGSAAMTNLIAVLPGKQREGIALAAHYDSKLEKDFLFLGANDAASAVAVLFELARKLKAGAADRELSYYFIFFDGEEAFREDWRSWEKETGTEDHTYGSRYFARTWDKSAYPFKTLILLDMVGDKDYNLKDDPASCSIELISIFKKASVNTFGVDWFTDIDPIGGDDHFAFKDEIPVMDVIDLDFKSDQNVMWWHTKEDTIDKLDPRSLERTGTLVLAALPDIEALVLKTVKVGNAAASRGTRPEPQPFGTKPETNPAPLDNASKPADKEPGKPK